MVLKKIFIGNVACISLAILFVCSPYLSAQESVEHKVKAAFIHKFIKYTKWSKAAFKSKNSPIIIGVLGKSPIWSELKNLEQKAIMGRHLKILNVNDSNLKEKYHILFVSKVQSHEAEMILKKINKNDVMTIGESKGFAKRGGMINFIIINGKLRFEINIKAIEDSGLNLSSKLLRLGRIVNAN